MNPADITTDIELERAMLCCLILQPEQIEDVGLVADDFYDEYHQQIFAALWSLRNGDVGISTLRAAMFAQGSEWYARETAEIMDARATGTHAKSYSVQLKLLSRRRQFLRLLRDLKVRASDPTENINVLIREATDVCLLIERKEKGLTD